VPHIGIDESLSSSISFPNIKICLLVMTKAVKSIGHVLINQSL